MRRSTATGRCRRLTAIASALLVGGLGGWWLAAALAQTHTHGSGHHHHADAGGWLVNLKGDARFQAVERQFRGIAPTMAEVAYRYTEMYFGGLDGNWPYAEHMGEELRAALEAGLERRPAHRKNAEAIFLAGPLPQVMDAIKRKQPEQFRQRVDALRAACTACHAAEGAPFIRIGIPQARLNPLERP
jgi:hypothetical protein